MLLLQLDTHVTSYFLNAELYEESMLHWDKYIGILTELGARSGAVG
jgi:hypothetical protein